MPHSEFIHLHLHTQYSLLDGACRVKEILELAKQHQMDSLAITDHGNMFGAIEFYLAAQKAGIKPIIGCEVYMAPKSRTDRGGEESSAYHLILLARDETGYHNLMKLVSAAYLEGFYYKPRIDKEILASHAEGLIGLSACLKGEIPSFLRQGLFNEALKTADTYSHIFGKGNFYLEVQENRIPEQTEANKGLVKLSRELSLPLVATNDVHYPTRDRAKAHDVLLCIQTQTTLDDPKRMRLQTDEFYFKSPREMKELFKEIPEAVTNTVEIAARCNLELDFGKYHLPVFTTPDGTGKEEYFRSLCEAGLTARFGAETPELRSRLELEFKTIKQMGFISYFLVVWDFIHFAKSQDIPVGPGRGSAAGSLISYLLGITDIDPLRYNLLFERFLNPERISMPDIDIDFCYERRPEVIDYVTRKYGRENVSQIITFGTMAARLVVRDVGRVMGMAYPDVDRIAKLIPSDPANPTGLRDALTAEPELNNLYKSDKQVKELIDIGCALEGLNRHASTHAAGVVIADKPLDNYMPLFKTPDDQVTSGYEMSSLEKLGMLKMDFLGLRTLTVLDQALKLIKETRGTVVDFRTVPLDDPATYKLLCEGKAMGVFQLESSGMRDLLKKLEPESFEDLIALLALSRPGPMGSGMLENYIKCKKKLVAVKYDHKRLEPILQPTYGIMLYQEQIMRVASEVGGFSLGQADLLRRAMSKKIPEVMEQQRKAFITGSHKNGVSETIANKIFDNIVFFSGYGFNRSHSAAYAVISYRTAFLKANYPVEFMTALLTSERENTDKIEEYIKEAQQMGIPVLPPDINASGSFFKVEGGDKIRFGLLAIKNVGKGAVESIIAARDTGGPFASLDDLCARVDLRLANRKVLESMIKCGVMDCFGAHRSSLFTSIEGVLERSSRLQKDRASGQLSFFDSFAQSAKDNGSPVAAGPEMKEWPESQLLAFEQELLGFYISGHPLTRYAAQLKRFSSSPINDLKRFKDQDAVKIVGLVKKVKNTITRKKQEKMAILMMEDLDGEIETLVFPSAYQKVGKYCQAGSVVMLRGRLDLKESTPKIICEDLYPMDEVYRIIQTVELNLSGLRENVFESLKELLGANQGQVPVYLHFDSLARSKVLVGAELFVQPSEKLLEDLDQLLGGGRISLKL